jgi:acetylornithine deacetylase/succinyl-diaminopimelate desuccinylase-like protein
MNAGEAELPFLADREDELVEFTRELVRTPSVNPPGDERAVVALARERLEGLGVGEIDVVGAEVARPNLLARVPGSGDGPALIFSGHLDTKPPGDLALWRTDPFDPVIEDGELYGLGSGDMKASVAAMVYAAGALAATGPRAGSLHLVLTADEEAGSVLGSRWLAENGHLHATAALVAEPCGIVREWEAIDLVSRGAALFKVRVRGTQMHSSISDRLPAVNATVMMARLVDRMHRELKGALTYAGHPLGGLGPTVNIGVMAQAGAYYGIYPGEAEFACDVRTLPGMTREQFEADLRAFLERAMADEPGLDCELVFEHWHPATEISPAEPIVRVLQAAAAEVLDEQPELGAFPGATDASYFQATAGIPTVAAFGPGFLSRAHSPNESVPVKAIGEAARMYALAAADYLGPNASS